MPRMARAKESVEDVKYKAARVREMLAQGVPYETIAAKLRVTAEVIRLVRDAPTEPLHTLLVYDVSRIPKGLTKRQIAEARVRELDKENLKVAQSAWYRPTCYVVKLDVLDSGHRVEFQTNQNFTCGDFEEIFTRGVTAMMVARGADAPLETGKIDDSISRVESRFAKYKRGKEAVT